MVFRVGAILMVLGLGMRLFVPEYSAYMVCLGAVLFASMQMLTRYDGSDFNLLRLRRQQLLSDIAFLFMAGAMFAQDHDMGPAWMHDNLWVMLMVVATILQAYTAFRIPQELERIKKS